MVRITTSVPPKARARSFLSVVSNNIGQSKIGGNYGL
jgi:rRNA maturation protein Rpf1